jgi:hypothetical protein
MHTVAAHIFSNCMNVTEARKPHEYRLFALSLNKENYFLTCVGFDSCWGDYGVLAPQPGAQNKKH